MKISIKDFQSIHEASLEVDGFTVITGPSNIGKSALIRAIDGAIFGIPGDYYINYEADTCSVEIHDDHSIEWTKVKESKVSPKRQTKLLVDGEKFTKFAQAQSELTQVFGVTEIEALDVVEKPQIAGQFDTIFLLFDSPFGAATVLNKLGRADIVDRAQSLAAKDSRDAQNRLKVRTQDASDLALKLAELAWVTPKLAEYSALEALIEEDAKAVETQDRLANLVVDLLSPSLQALPLPEAPVITDISPELQVIQSLEELQRIEIKELPESPVIVAQDHVLAQIQVIDLVLTLIPAAVPEKITLDTPDKVLYALSVFDELIVVEKERRFAGKQIVEYMAKTTELKNEIKNAERELKVCPMCGRSYDYSKYAG